MMMTMRMFQLIMNIVVVTIIFQTTTTTILLGIGVGTGTGTVSASTSISTSSLSSSSSSTSSWRNNRFVQALHAHYTKAQELATIEQQVEDYNAKWVATSTDAAQATSKRRLICLPLDDRFDPPMGMFSHGHIQTGDKISLPSCFLTTIKLNQAEVPWLFKVTRVEQHHQQQQDGSGDGSGRSRRSGNESGSGSQTSSSSSRVDVDVVSKGYAALPNIQELVAGPLDCRAPANYCFMPWWMMRVLQLKPLDQVEVQLIKSIPPGSLVKLRPHSSEFAKDISNAQAVLETELRHYSSLTQGSTIAFDYNGKRYWFDVEELRSAPKGEKQTMVKLQDCDVATDFLLAKDLVQERKRKKLEAARKSRAAQED